MIDTLYHYLSTAISKGSTAFALFFAIFRELFAKYVFNDWDFVGFLFVLVLGDTVFGIIRSIKQNGFRSLSFSEAEKLLIKVFLYFGVLVLSHVMGSFTVHGKVNTMYTWIDSVLYGYIITKESFSLAKNINGIKPAYVPDFFMDRLAKFEKTGKLSDLFNDIKKDEPN